MSTLVPCLPFASQLRIFKRPVTITLSPVRSDAFACSPSCRKAATEYQLVPASTQRCVGWSKRREVLATLKLVTGMPLAVCPLVGSVATRHGSVATLLAVERTGPAGRLDGRRHLLVLGPAALLGTVVAALALAWCSPG